MAQPCLRYDHLSRLTSAAYFDVNGTGAASASNRFNEGTIAYDLRGNITALQRNGYYAGTCGYGQIDNLTYTYASSTNRISSIADNAPASQQMHGFNPGAGGVGYGYDANGNLKSDSYKGISNIAYNHLVTNSASTNDIVQENHYYPFGLGFEGPWLMNDAARDNAYRYNGKELNEDFGLNWYDYGARYYDPAVGRFTGVDPIADQFAWVTPYNYAENEPVHNIDLHGLQAVSAEIAMDRDVKDYVEGRIDEKEYWARARARFEGGIAGLGGVGLGGVIKSGVQRLIGWAISNPATAIESANILTGLVWGLGTDAEAPGAGDNIGRSIKKVSELEGVQVLSNDVAAAIRGDSRYFIYGGIEKAGSRLVYIGTKNGLPYIGKTQGSITGRYPDVNEAPLPFTDYFKAPSESLLDIEAALINFNGGPKGGRIANKYRSTGDSKKGEEWLNKNIPDWRNRFNF